MTAKEKQLVFIKETLKPMFKQKGYYTNGPTWWKDRGDFIVLVNLQNFSWNSKESVDFCFNIGIAITKKHSYPVKKKPNVHDLTVYLREGAYLPTERKTHQFLNSTGYSINSSTALTDFIIEFKIDFEEIILPQLEKLETLQNCLEYFKNVPFWYDQLKKAVAESDHL